MTKFKWWMIMLMIAWISAAGAAIITKDVSAFGKVSIITFCTGLYYAFKNN